MEELGLTPSSHIAFRGDATGNGGSVQLDGFQALVAGELPGDRTLVGEGQRLTPAIVDLFLKVDGKLKVAS